MTEFKEGCKSTCPTMKTLKCSLGTGHAGAHWSEAGGVKWYKGRVFINDKFVSDRASERKIK